MSERFVGGQMDNTRLRYLVAVLSVATPVLHRLFSSSAQNEQWHYSALIFGALLSQGLFGVVLAISPWRYDSRGNVRRDHERHARRYYRVGLIISVIFLGLYTLAQMIGTPPDVSVLMVRLLPNLLEVALVIGFTLLLRRSRGG